MTRKEFIEEFDIGGSRYFFIEKRMFQIEAHSIWDDDEGDEDDYIIDKFGINEAFYEISTATEITWYKTIDEMLELFLIDGKPLVSFISDIKEIHRILYA